MAPALVGDSKHSAVRSGHVTLPVTQDDFTGKRAPAVPPDPPCEQLPVLWTHVRNAAAELPKMGKNVRLCRDEGENLLTRSALVSVAAAEQKDVWIQTSNSTELSGGGASTPLNARRSITSRAT